MKGDMQHFKPAFKGCVVIPLTDDDDDLKRIKYVASKQTNKTLGALLTWFANCTDDHARYMVFIRCLDKVIESLGADIE